MDGMTVGKLVHRRRRVLDGVERASLSGPPARQPTPEREENGKIARLQALPRARLSFAASCSRRARASRLPMPRNAAMAFSCSARGLATWRSQL